MLLRSAMQYVGDGFELAGHVRNGGAKVLMNRDDRTLMLCGVLMLRNNQTTLKGEKKSGEKRKPSHPILARQSRAIDFRQQIGQRGVTCTS